MLRTGASEAVVCIITHFDKANERHRVDMVPIGVVCIPSKQSGQVASHMNDQEHQQEQCRSVQRPRVGGGEDR